GDEGDGHGAIVRPGRGGDQGSRSLGPSVPPAPRPVPGILGGVDRAALAAALRSYRARLTPADVGLPAGTRRRVPGLRREEGAQLAGLSVDYPVRLEQGRSPAPSELGPPALARALRLTDDERDHLFHLTGVRSEEHTSEL